jgi:tape measure domain-containing protein
MSTLERLKQRLNLTGASKGLENLGSAAKKVDLSGVGNAVDTVRTKFSALDVIGVTALANIANQAVNTGKKMVSALTIDPIKSGFQEYETQINAVQTILANTSHNGTTLDQVNEALDTLNKYADKTIYNFTEMTRNIGTFTAAGVDLQTSVDSIQGIANLAAVSGSTSQQASTAMYQLSQALAAGKVSLMDWNSVVNAGMGGKVFQDALVRTSELLKTGAKDAINSYGSFRESLTKGEWLTTEVLTETLKQFSGAYSEADLIAQGFTEEQAKDIAKMAATAEEAATKVKTFTQLWDVLKESAQSGWTQTWELLIGGYEDAKNLLSPLADFLTGIINRVSDARNKLIEGAMGSPLGKFAERITNLKDNLGEMTGAVDTVTKTVKGLGEVVDKVIGGEFGNGQARWDKLTEAGYNWAEVQNKVNEKLGSSVRHTNDLKESQDELGESQSKLNKSQLETLDQLTELSYAKLKDMNLSHDEIVALQALKEQSEKTGISVKDLVEDVSLLEGRSLLINTFKNAGSGLVTIFKAIGTAWRDAFPPMRSDQLYDIIAAVHKFSTHLIVGEETADKLTRTLKGVFAIIGMVTDVLGGGFKIAFKAVSALLGYFDMDILSVTASIGDALVAFREATDITKLFGKAIDFAAPYITSFARSIRGWVNGFMELPRVQGIIQDIKDAFATLKELDFKEIGRNIIDGLINGMDSGALEAVKRIVQLGIDLILEFCHTLGICSPSKEFFELGGYIIEGLVNGLQNGASAVINWFKNLGTGIIDLVSKIDWGSVFAFGVSLAGVLFIKKVGDVIEAFASPFEGLGDIFEETADVVKNAAKVVKSFSKVLNGISFDIKANAIKKLAIALAILAGSVILLTYFYDDNMWKSVGIIGALAGILVGLAVGMNLLSKTSVKFNKEGLNIDGIKSSLLTIALAIGVLGLTVKLIGSMEPEEAKQGFLALAGMMVGILAFLAITRKVVSNKAAKNISEIGVLMTKISIAMLLMVAVAKLAGNLSDDEINRGVRFVAGFGIFVGALVAVTKSGAKQHISKVGGLLIKVAIAMGLMVGVVKLVDLLEPEEMIKAAGFAAGFTLFVKGLLWAVSIGKDKEFAKLGGLLLSISLSMGLMVGVCKLVNKLSKEEMLKGAAFVAGFTLFVKGLVSIVTIGNDKQIAKVTGTILAVSVAIGILAAVSMMLSLLSLDGLAKGVIAVSVLGSVMALMIYATKDAQNVKGNLIAISVAIGILAVAVAGLSFIEPSKLYKSVGAISIVLGMFALVLKSSKDVTGSMGTIITITVAIGLLAGILWALSELDVQASLTNAAALSLLLTAVSGCMFILGKANLTIKNALVGVLALTAMAVPLLAFVGVLTLMDGVKNATANTKALVSLATTLTLLLIPLTIVGYLWPGAAIGIVALTAMAIPLLAFVGVLSLMEGIKNATANTELLIDLMSTMTDLLVKLSPIAPLALIGVGAMAGLTGLMVAIGVLAVGVGAVMDKFPSLQKFLDTGLPVLEQLAESIGTMIGKFVSGIGEGLGDTLVKMGTDIAAFMDALSVASDNASGIKAESFAGVKELMSVMGDIALTTVGTTLGDIFTFGGTSMEKFQKDGVAFFEAMKSIGEASSNVVIDPDAVNSVIGVAEDLAALQSSLEPIGGVITWFTGRDDLGKFGANAASFINSMKLAFENLNGTYLNTEAMGSVIDAATKLAGIQSSLEPMGGVISWFSGRSDLGAFGINIAQFIRSIIFAFNSLEGSKFNTEAMTAVITAATQLAKLQSSLEPIGGVISWFTGRDDLGTFGINVGQFIASMKIAFNMLEGVTFNTEAMTAVITAATQLAKLQSSLEPIGGVITWFTGRDDLGKFGTNVSQFIGSMKLALGTLEGATLDSEALQSVITAATELAKLQSSLEPIGGVVTWFTGRDDLGTFGTNIGLFAAAMGALKTGMGENGISEDVITSVTNAGNAIIELQKALPTEGWFDGKMDLSEFSGYVSEFSAAMTDFSAAAVEIDSAAVSTVISTAYRIKSLINSLVDLDTSGLTAFTGVGTGGIGADGAVYKIAQAISAYSDQVAGIDTNAVSISVTAAQKLKNLITSLVDLDTSGIDKFKTDSIGTQMKNYADKVANIDTMVVSSSVSAANRLKTFIAGLANLDVSGINNFQIQTIGSSIKSYHDKIAEVDMGVVGGSISAASRLASFIKSLAGIDTSGATAFKTAIRTLSEVNISALAEAFKDAGKIKLIGTDIVTSITKGIDSKQTNFKTSGVKLATNLADGISSKKQSVTNNVTKIITGLIDAIAKKKDTFHSTGASLMSKLASGLESKKSTVTSAATSPVSSAVSSIRGYYDSFYSAGAYVVAGFASGISENTFQAESAAAAMASAAYKAAKKKLDINSPSKVFRRLGFSVPEGFAQGIDRLSRVVKSSSVSMADTAINTVGKSISRMASAINSDVDAQPTIRPVLDLSDVKSGVHAIGGMFNNAAFVGVSGNVGTVGYMMNQYGQNGTNDDVISAIDKLRDKLGNVGNTTYVVEGVTYDDGSNISNAVKDIVRAAKVERRI